MKRVGTEFDRFTNAPSASQQQWLRDHFYRMAAVFSPYFDSRLSWFPNAWLYIDLYAIAKNSPLVTQHPDWILRDSSGNFAYVPWGCSNGTCPQYAGDPSNASFRRWWIDQAKIQMAKGYKGMWIDDVNMQFRVGNANGVEIPPIDRNTGQAMTWTNWRRYIAEFVEQIRVELPGVELTHNCIWFAGPSGVRDQDPYIQRQIAAADYINCERGFTDPGLTGGTGEWSVNALLAFIDRVHAKGKKVLIDEYYPPSLQYSVANYFLISTGSDGIGDLITTPDNWWHGFDVDLGAAKGNRYSWNGFLRRDFDRGIVLVNEPGAPTRTATLPGSYKNIDGITVSSVSLGAAQGAILIGDAPVSQPPSGSNVYYLSDMSWSSVSNGWGAVERDRSNGEQGSSDGRPITLAGTVYAKGLGVHGRSEIKYELGGACTAFQASVGVDDEIRTGGSVVFQVWADGSKLYDSGVMRSDSSTKTVNTGISGKNQLTLLVTDAGDGPGSDHADWANARVSCNARPAATVLSKTAYLSDMSWSYASNAWGLAELDRANGGQPAGDGGPITLNGHRYAKGLGVHAYSELRYNIGRACSSFIADLGVDDSAGSNGSLVFQVWADGLKLYDSGVVTGSSNVQYISLGIGNRDQLRLVVTDGGDGNGWDHASWANARVVCNP